MHPEEIEPKDTKSEDLSKTAIALTMQDPEDKDSIISCFIPMEWFFDGEATRFNNESVPFGDYANVEITYKNRTLLIETDAIIDVSIESSIPTHALIVKTAGDCNINSMIGLHDSITIQAKDISFNADTASDRLTLLCNKDALNSIKINAEVITNSLNATVNQLIISGILDAKTRILDCNKISIEQTGAFTPVGFPNARYEKENSNNLAYVLPVDTSSRITIEDLENHGRFDSNNGTIIVKSSIKLCGQSITKLCDDKLIFPRISFDSAGSFESTDSHLIWVKSKGKNRSQLALDGTIKFTRTILQHPSVIFRKDCNAHLSNTKIISKRHILLNANPIKGSNVELNTTERLYTRGDCDINNLVINTNMAKIRSVLDGNDFMSFKADGQAEVHGLLYGKNTVYQGIFVVLTPFTKDRSMLDQTPYKYCRKGGLVGTESLSINTLALVRIAGGYIYGRNLNVMTGVDINIGGLSYAYNYNFQRVCAPIELGFDLPWLPNGIHDLVNINKILSLSYRMIITVGKVEYSAIVSGLILAAAVGPTVVRGGRSVGNSLYEDPNPLNHLRYARDAVVDTSEKIARRTKELGAYCYKTASSTEGLAAGVDDMRKTISEFCNLKKLLELVNCMLNAKGMYIAGNSIFCHATNVAKFTTSMQQGTLPTLNLQEITWKLADNFRTHAALNSDNQPSKYNWELFKFLGEEIFMFLGPSVYKSTLTLAVDYNLIMSGTVVQDAAILVEGANVYSVNSASYAIVYFNRGNYHGSHRIESAMYRYDNGEHHTQSLQVNAKYNSVYGKFKPQGKLVFNVASNHVAPGAEFILPADTIGFVNSDFINEGKVVISGREFIIKGKFHVKRNGIANINNAYFQKDRLIVEGKYTAFNSILSESDQLVAKDAEYSIINSERHGDSVTWEKGAKVNVINSNMYGSNFQDLGASVTTSNARFKMKCIYRDGHWQVSDLLIFEGANVQSTPQSTLTGTQISHVEVHADHADLQGAESVQSAVVNVKNMSASEISEYVNKIGKHANKTMYKQLVMQTDKNEAIELNSFGRGDVGVAIVTPGTITQNAPYNGRSLGLHSAENSVHLNNDVSTELDTSIFAKKHIFKPGIVVESFKGNVQLIAEEGTLNNDNGGQILAHSGDATAVGAQFSNNTNGASRMSAVSGNNVIAQATQGSFDILRGLLKAKTVLEIYSATDFNLQPEIIREWLSQHEMGNVYHGSVLQGGTGTAENGRVGLILKVGGKFNGTASSINSTGKNLIFVNKDIHGETKITVYKAEDRKEKHGFFKFRHYFTSQEAKEFRMEIVSGDENIIHSLEGKIELEGVKTFAPNGTKTFLSQEMIAQSVPYTLNNTHNKNSHIYESANSSQSEQESMTVYAQTTGITSFTSDKVINHIGVAYLGLPGSEFRFIAPDGVTLTSSILNHRSSSTSLSAQLSLFGQTLTGSGRQLNPINTFYYLDPTSGSLGDFAHSSNIAEVIVNGASSIYGMSNMLSGIAANGLMNTLSSQMGASLVLSRSRTKFDYQTEGLGGFYGGANINIQTDGIVTFAVNVYDKIPIFDIRADELRLYNTELNSRYTNETVSVAPSVNLDGSYDVSVSYAHQSYRATTQIQRNLAIGKFNINVRYLHNRGTDIVCNQINGKADIIENESTINTSSSTQTQLSASLQGNVSGNHVRATEQTEGAKARILVTDGINNEPEHNFEVQTVVNHGDANISTMNPDSNHFLEQGTKVVHLDQNLKSKRVGGGFSNNFLESEKKPLPKVSVDFLNQQNTLSEDGLATTSKTKFKATMPMPNFAPPKAEPLINLSEASESNASSGRQPSILGNALEQLESDEFLTDPGYRYGRPSSAVGDTDVKNLHEPRVTQNDSHYVPEDSLYMFCLPKPEYSPEDTNKSFGRKVFDFWSDVSNDADEAQTDFYDIKSTKELNVGRAAVVRGFAKGAVNAVQPILHPIDTVAELGVVTWDGLNELTDLTFGVATNASRERGRIRGSNIVGALDRFNDADAVQKIEMGSEVAGSMLFGYALSSATGLTATSVRKKMVISNPVLPLFASYQSATVINAAKVESSFYANSVNAQAAIRTKIRALQKAQHKAIKTEELSDGRIRYYMKETPSISPGATRGASYVTEHNPRTGRVRSWLESYDHFGKVNRIHPKMIDGQDLIGQHYPPTAAELKSWLNKPRGAQ
jgi:hypothetical protein